MGFCDSLLDVSWQLLEKPEQQWLELNGALCPDGDECKRFIL